VTPAAQNLDLSATPLADVPPDPCRWSIVTKYIDVDYVAVHMQLFGNDQPNKWHRTTGPALVAALDRMPGLTRVSQVKDVVTYKFDRNALACRR
jgi:hypothetical protein